MEYAGDFMGRQHGADREAAAEGFGAGQNIRRHAVVHIGEQLTAAPHAALHFIKHQQSIMRIAQFTQPFEELRGCRGNATLALNRLYHHGAGVIVHHRFNRVKIVKRNMHDVGRFRAKAVGVFRLTANGYGKERASVKSVVESDDFGFVRAVARGCIKTRQLEGGFVGFGTGVHKHDALGKGGVHQLTRQTQRGLVGKDVAQVPEGLALRFQRLHQRRMAVT